MNQWKKILTTALLSSSLLLNTSCYSLFANQRKMVQRTQIKETVDMSTYIIDPNSFRVDASTETASFFIQKNPITEHQYRHTQQLMPQDKNNALPLILSTAGYLAAGGAIIGFGNGNSSQSSGLSGGAQYNNTQIAMLLGLLVFFLADSTISSMNTNPGPVEELPSTKKIFEEETEAYIHGFFVVIDPASGKAYGGRTDANGFASVNLSLYDHSNQAFILKMPGMTDFRAIEVTPYTVYQIETALEIIAERRTRNNQAPSVASFKPCSGWGILITGLFGGGAEWLKTKTIHELGDLLGLTTPENSQNSGNQRGVMSYDTLDRLVVAAEALVKREDLTEAMFMNELENKIKSLIPGKEFTQEVVYAAGKQFWDCYHQSR